MFDKEMKSREDLDVYVMEYRQACTCTVSNDFVHNLNGIYIYIQPFSISHIYIYMQCDVIVMIIYILNKP